MNNLNEVMSAYEYLVKCLAQTEGLTTLEAWDAHSALLKLKAFILKASETSDSPQKSALSSAPPLATLSEAPPPFPVA